MGAALSKFGTHFPKWVTLGDNPHLAESATDDVFLLGFSPPAFCNTACVTEGATCATLFSKASRKQKWWTPTLLTGFNQTQGVRAQAAQKKGSAGRCSATVVRYKKFRVVRTPPLKQNHLNQTRCA